MIPANYSTISFPSLGIEVNPGRALALGPLTIHYYGLIIAIGLMLAVVYACRRCSQFGIKQDDLLDGVLWVTPFAILCARAYYCIFSWADYAENPFPCCTSGTVALPFTAAFWAQWRGFCCCAASRRSKSELCWIW